MGMELTRLSATELAKKIRAGEVTVREAVEVQLETIEVREDVTQAYVTVLREDAIKKAEEIQKKIDAGELKDCKLAGVPIAIKDNICTKGRLTTCASRILENFVPTYNATVVEKLEAAGCIIIGKTNMDEFAMGSTSETSAYKTTKNPWDVSRAPGGSSGGSAAAVSAEEAFIALGSDTGGSIRQPSGYCGVVGMKPTYGTVSRYGLIAYASSLDQIGSIARNVTDCATLLEIISGHDPKDSTSVSTESYDYTSCLKNDVKGMKIGIPKAYLLKGLNEEVKTEVLKAAKKLESLGAIVEEFDFEGMDYAIPAYYVIATAEASSNLSRYDGIKYGYRTKEYDGLQDLYKKSRSEGFGDEVKRRMMIGSFVLSSGYYDAYYNKALKVKALLKRSFDQAFERYDMILGPVAPEVAPKLGDSLSDPLKMYLTDIYTVSVNLAGLPAICLPCGFDSKGMPIGLQLIGQAFGEKKILQAAYTFEQSFGYHRPEQLI